MIDPITLDTATVGQIVIYTFRPAGAVAYQQVRAEIIGVLKRKVRIRYMDEGAAHLRNVYCYSLSLPAGAYTGKGTNR